MIFHRLSEYTLKHSRRTLSETHCPVLVDELVARCAARTSRGFSVTSLKLTSLRDTKLRRPECPGCGLLGGLTADLAYEGARHAVLGDSIELSGQPLLVANGLLVGFPFYPIDELVRLCVAIDAIEE